MQKNLNSFERVVRLLLGLFALLAAAVLFKHTLARLAVSVFGLYSLWESAAAKCPLHAALGMRSPGEGLSQEKLGTLGLAAIQAVLAYEWWSAGWEKASSPDFVVSIDKTLGYFASNNPFSWYKVFLEGFAMKNAMLFAFAVEWSQIAVALALISTAGVILWAKNEKRRRLALMTAVGALLGGMLMNANFYLAAGWTGPGTKSSNVIMFWVQAVLLYVWVSSLTTSSKMKP
jgi:hypothetical protein